MNSKKHIAIFHNLPGGGALRVIENIVKRYGDRYMFDVYVVSDLNNRAIKGANVIYKKVTPWKTFLLRNLWIYLILPVIHKNVADTLNHGYDKVLVTHDYFTKSPYLLRYLKVKSIYICHEPQREFYEPLGYHISSIKEFFAMAVRLPLKYIDLVNVSFAHEIVSNSQYSRGVIKKVYKKKSSVIYPGVDTDKFRPLHIKKKKQILCIGGLNPTKDQLFLVSALKELTREYLLVLVGKGKCNYVRKIKHTIRNSENLKIIKSVTDTQLIKLYNESVLTCITARLEPFGLTSIESQSCGTPVVAINEGGVVETIANGKTGYVSIRNENIFLTAVSSALLRAKSMSKVARRVAVDNWSWKSTLKKFDKILER